MSARLEHFFIPIVEIYKVNYQVFEATIKFCIFVFQIYVVMTTITLKINEKTKAGKALLSIVNLISSENKGVEVCDAPNFETVKAMYEAKIKMGLTKAKNSKDLFKKLGI
jgi:hypothetical protein